MIFTDWFQGYLTGCAWIGLLWACQIIWKSAAKESDKHE